jgi:CBS domain-containing protein
MRAAEAPPRGAGSTTVGAIMSAPVVTTTPAATVAEARRRCQAAGVRHLPVVDNGLLVGMVAACDLDHAPDESGAVAAVMTPTVFIAFPEMLLAEAARVFRRRPFCAMPVLRGRDLVGIVSRADVTRALAGGGPAGARSGPTLDGARAPGGGPEA